MPTLPHIPFRVRIGVTGHRSLPQDPVFRQRIVEVVDRIKADYSKVVTVPLAFTVVTPLAEGADQVVASAVMKVLGSRLRAVIPLALPDYMADFTSEETKRTFSELLAQDPNPVYLRTVLLDGDRTQENVRKARNSAYREAGEYVVRNCDVLIAIWDREPAKGEGGTAEIIRFAEVRKIPVYIITVGPPYSVEVRPGAGVTYEGLDALSMFNRTPVNMSRAAAHDPTVDSVIEAAKHFDFPTENVTAVEKHLRPSYLRASYLAGRYQRRHYQMGGRVYTLAALVIVASTVSMLLGKHDWLFAVGELLGMILIVFIVHRARKNHYQRMWVDLRLLAERLRIATVLLSCGQGKWLVANIHSPNWWQARGDWTSRVVSEILFPWSNVQLPQPPLDAQREFLRRHWIQHQLAYHQHKAADLERRNRRLDYLGTGTFYLGLVAVAVNLMIIIFRWDHSAASFFHWLVLSSFALPAFGAAFSGIRKHREYDRLSAKSFAMTAMLSELDVRAANADTEEHLGEVMSETYQLVISEAEDWHLLVRALVVDRPA